MQEVDLALAEGRAFAGLAPAPLGDEVEGQLVRVQVQARSFELNYHGHVIKESVGLSPVQSFDVNLVVGLVDDAT